MCRGVPHWVCQLFVVPIWSMCNPMKPTENNAKESIGALQFSTVMQKLRYKCKEIKVAAGMDRTYRF